MTIQDELLLLKIDNPLLQPETAVEWARKNPKSALHGALEWDDSVAGHQYRIWQVRRLIAIHVISEAGERQMVSLSIDRVSPGGGYRDINEVLSVPTMRDILLEDALRELHRTQAKYGRLKELAAVWEEVGKASTKAAGKKGNRKAVTIRGKVEHAAAG